MTGDLLSGALALTDATCMLSGGFRIGGTWALQFQPEQRLKLAAIVRGSCWLTADGLEAPLHLQDGDVAVLNDRQVVVLASDPSVEPRDRREVFDGTSDAVIQIGVEDEVLCIGGHVALNRGGEDLLLGALPPVMHVRARDSGASIIQWLLGQLAAEMAARRPGYEFATHGHAQLLFVEVLRAYLDSNDAVPAGWLRALADDRLAPALQLMHADPGRTWRLEELARAAAMSRTTFTERFKATAGVPPLTYLHDWRMRLAERALRDEDITIAQLSHTLGYASESSFSNAFKRTNGIAPKRYRVASRSTTTQGGRPSRTR
jgi:AraC-like DNA-binding protein